MSTPKHDFWDRKTILWRAATKVSTQAEVSDLIHRLEGRYAGIWRSEQHVKWDDALGTEVPNGFVVEFFTRYPEICDQMIDENPEYKWYSEQYN